MSMVGPKDTSSSSLLLEDRNSRKRYPISAGASFGRSEADHRFEEDSQLSRKHFRVWGEKGKIYIRDMGSRNRTRVNGALVPSRESLEIFPGDEITAGKLRLLLKDLDLPGGVLPPEKRIKPKSPRSDAGERTGIVAQLRGFFGFRKWKLSTGFVVLVSLGLTTAPHAKDLLEFDLGRPLPHSGTALVVFLAGVLTISSVPVWFFHYWITRRILPAGWSRFGAGIVAIVAISLTSNTLLTAWHYEKKIIENRVFTACIDPSTRGANRCHETSIQIGTNWAEVPSHYRRVAEAFRRSSLDRLPANSAPPGTTVR